MDRENERKVLHESFAKCKELFQHDQTRTEFNLCQSMRNLTTDWQAKHFYSFIANPHGYNEKEVEQRINVKDEVAKIEPYEPHMKVVEYKNGPETFIHVRNENLYNQDDEKTVSV